MSDTIHNTIVVGFDGSEPAKAALDWATRVAVAKGMTVHILAARDTQQSPDLAEPAAAQLRESHPDLKVTASAPVGSARYLLADASDYADVIVVGNRGRSRWRAAILGTTSLSTAMHSDCPVVIVRADQPAAAPPQRVVVGVDGSGPSASAVDYAVAISAPGAEVSLVMAWSTARSDDHVPPFARDILTRTLGDRDTTGINLDLTPRAGHPVDVLATASREVDLLVVGRRGAEGFNGLSMGSTAAHVLNEATCPVMLIPPTEK